MARAPAEDDEQDARPKDPDAIDGAAHPRETRTLVGHDAALDAFETAWAQGRAHHAWLLRGAPGIGKATLAYAAARRALSADASDEGQIQAGAHPRLFELRRAWDEKAKKFKSAIAVDDVRRMISFFQLKAADGGWRVGLVDPADDLNRAAANALLKLIEEPPDKALFLLTSAAPGRLPATIRSRCRALDMALLQEEDADAALAAAAPGLSAETRARLLALAPGAPGAALRLDALDGLELYGDVVQLLAALPRLDDARLDALSAAAATRDGGERFGTVAAVFSLALGRLARAAAGRPPANDAAPGERAVAARLSAAHGAAALWAEAALDVRDRLEQARGLNLDPQRAILDTAYALADTARRALGPV